MLNIKNILILALALVLAPTFAQGVRIKDLTTIEGVRGNQLVGYGLVVGLNGTGDSKDTSFTIQSLINMLERMGVTVEPDKVQVDNVAAVMVTAELPAFARAGSNIDVSVASIGDAENLAGGTLMMTPLKAADGQYYAVAQGQLVVGSLAFGGETAKVQKNHPTSGRVPGGAIVEREPYNDFSNLSLLKYRLKDADFTTLERMTRVVNAYYGAPVAKAIDSVEMQINLPASYQNRLIEFVAEIENLDVTPDSLARIVVNEKTGTIVMGSNVRISTVAVSHGNLSLTISEAAKVSQPNPLGTGRTVVVPETSMNVVEEKSNIIVMNMGASIGDVASALNAIGASPRDLIAIFQAIKVAGALHAELVIL
ncbi:MAG: flagellar basal body P-ring protein FlgI [Deltaproteobacteria bacterium]|nr:flagellar basal body P-ring protein FlgI [Deltaproteobacteria bacterium]